VLDVYEADVHVLLDTEYWLLFSVVMADVAAPPDMLSDSILADAVRLCMSICDLPFDMRSFS
jgi:hypothetical protein